MENLNLNDKIKIITGVFKNKTGRITRVLDNGYYIHIDEYGLKVDGIVFYGNELEKVNKE